MKSATRSIDWMRTEEKYKFEKRPQVTCFNARIDFLNNLSDGIVKKLPKQRKVSSSRELEMPLPPGCFPEKVSLALSKSSSSLCDSNTSSSSNGKNRTMSTNLDSVSTLASEIDLENRVDTWYASLCKASIEEDPVDHENKEMVRRAKQTLTPHLPRIPLPDGFKRMTRAGSSLKLQNGSYPTRYSMQKKNNAKNNNNNNNNNNNKTKKSCHNKNRTIEEISEVSLASDLNNTADEFSNMGTLSSELYDPSSDKIADPFSRSSSPLSDTPSLRSEQNSMISVDSTYGTSEFSSFSTNNSKTNKGDSAYDFERLANVIDHIDGETLRQQIKACLMTKKPRYVKALSSLLPATKFTGKTTHCIRCHSEYDKKHGNPSCVIRHPNSEVVMISDDGKSALFQCESCNCVFKLDDSLEYDEHTTDIMNSGACFLGQHTDSTDGIKYRPEGVAKTCNDHGCAIFYV